MPNHLLDPEQPTTCPLCGARTSFEEIPKCTPPAQKHTCLDSSCNYQFIGEFEPEDFQQGS